MHWVVGASCLVFNNAAGSQPILTVATQFDRPLKSTSLSVIKLDLTAILIFWRVENTSFWHGFSDASRLTFNSAAGTQPPKMIVTSSDRPLKSTSISVMCLTLGFHWLEHQRKNLHFCQYSEYDEYPQVRNALSCRASCLSFNSEAGSQPIWTAVVQFDRPLKSTSGSVMKLGLKAILIFWRI